MIRPGLLILITAISIFGGILGSTFEQHTGTDWYGEAYENQLEYMMDFKNATYQQASTGGWTFVMFNTEYFKTWLQALTFDFTYLDGELEILRWIFFVPLAIPVVYLMMYGFVQLLQGFIPFT